MGIRYSLPPLERPEFLPIGPPIPPCVRRLRIDKANLLEDLVDPAVLCRVIEGTFPFRCLAQEKLDSIPIL